MNLDLYPISTANLGQIHYKVMHSTAILSVLSDWINEIDAVLIDYESKDKIIQVLCLLIELMQDTENLLPTIHGQNANDGMGLN